MLAACSAVQPPGPALPTASPAGGGRAAGGGSNSGGAGTGGPGSTGGGITGSSRPVGTLSLRTYPVPTASSGLDSIAAGPDGALWFTELDADKVGRITTGGRLTEYPVPSSTDGVSGTGPSYIVASGGAMWFLNDGGASVYRIAASGADKRLYDSLAYSALNLAPSAAGGVWLMMAMSPSPADGDGLGLLTATGRVTFFPATHPYGPPAIELAPGGTSVWYSNQGDSLNSINAAGQERSHPVTSLSADDISSFAFARNGTVYYTEYLSGEDLIPSCCGAVGYVSGHTSHITPVGPQQTGQGILPHSLLAGPGGDLYFAVSISGTAGFSGIGRIDPRTNRMQLASTGHYVPGDMTLGPDGALWFVDSAHNVVGRIPASELSF